MESRVDVQSLWRYLEHLEPSMDSVPVVFQDADGENYYIRSVQEYLEVEKDEQGLLNLTKRFIILKSVTIEKEDIC